MLTMASPSAMGKIVFQLQIHRHRSQIRQSQIRRSQIQSRSFRPSCQEVRATRVTFNLSYYPVSQLLGSWLNFIRWRRWIGLSIIGQRQNHCRKKRQWKSFNVNWQCQSSWIWQRLFPLLCVSCPKVATWTKLGLKNYARNGLDLWKRMDNWKQMRRWQENINILNSG